MMDDVMDYADYMDEVHTVECPLCGARLKPKRSYEFADADGNRGIWIDVVSCKCGYEG
jgi:C4-type Zn-finger protein